MAKKKVKLKMEQVFVNTEAQVEQYTVETKYWQGKEYLVVPVVMMVEGVHSGSRGAIFHSAEELGKSAGRWDGLPVTISHPQVGDEYVSANSEQILNDWGVGHISNSRMEGDKLRAEAWLDVQKLVALSPETLSAIKSGEVLEVSVGLYSDEDNIEGVWNDEEYSSTASNYKPDHLALLPGEVGACSVMDGCGVRVNKQSKKEGGNDVNVGEIFNNLNKDDTPVKQRFYSYTVSGDDVDVTYKQEFTLTDNAIELVGEPIKEDLTVNKKEEVKIMCKPCKEKAAALIANANTHFDENDKGWLEGLTEDKLDKMIPKVVQVNKEPEPVTKEKALEVLGVEKEQYEKGLEIYNAKRKEVIDAIIANTEKDVWTEETLGEMKLDVLEKIEKSVKKTTQTTGVYVGAGANDDKSEIAPMPIPGIEFEN